MAKAQVKSNLSRTRQVFDDLDSYRDFCRDHGYRFDERDLYSSKSYVYRQFQKFVAGKPVKNQWEIDLARFKEQGTNIRRI
jgi:hypothetical protein